MVRKNIVVIRVVTLEDQTLLRMHGDLIEAYYPCLLYTSPSPRDTR